MENTSAWTDIIPDEEIVLSAWHFDDGEGVSAFPCSEYMDKTSKAELLSKNSGDILYYLVFSRKSSDELLDAYSVSERAKELYQAKNPYLGDVTADETILQLINIASFGEYTLELNTKETGYGITINFAESPRNEYTTYNDMLKKAALFLILTDNAEYFEWTYPAPDETEVRRFRCSSENLEQILQIEDIKSFSSSETDLQIFLTEYLQTIHQYYEPAAESSTSGSDGFLAPDGRVYKYKMLFTGRHPNAAADNTYLVYTNDTDLTFEDITDYIFGNTYPKERQMYIIPQPE